MTAPGGWLDGYADGYQAEQPRVAPIGRARVQVEAVACPACFSLRVAVTHRHPDRGYARVICESCRHTWHEQPGIGQLRALLP